MTAPTPERRERVVTVADPRELMLRAQAGDLDAFGQLYTHYRPMVFHIAKQFSPRHAEDIVQDTFARALGALHTWTDQGANPGAWLRTIARNLCRDRARSAYERKVDLQADAGEDRTAEPSQVDPALLAVQADTRRRAVAAMAGISRGQRDVLIQYYLQDVPIADIAQARGITRNGIRVLLCNARRNLREVLAVADA